MTAAALAGLLDWPPTAVGRGIGRAGKRRQRHARPLRPGAADDEWCERHLLARIHRYTIKRLRSEIEPVSRQDFMRFLFDWQHLSPEARLRGPQSLPQVLNLLEGYEAAAGAWESELLAARIADYEPAWLDELSRAGKVAWTPCLAGRRRRGAGARHAAGDPPRRQLRVWQSLAAADAAAPPSPRAQEVQQALLDGGAMFYDELQAQTRLLPSQLEEALGELVAAGLATSGRLRGAARPALPASRRGTRAGTRRRRGARCPSRWKRPGAGRRCGRRRWRRTGRRDLHRHRRHRPASARAQAKASACRRCGAAAARCPRNPGTRRARTVAPLRRGVLAPARSRTRLAAALARMAAGAASHGGARRSARRPLCGRAGGRAVRPARGHSAAARGGATGRRTHAGRGSRRSIR